MAFIWIDTDGNGISVTETARAMVARFEEDGGQFIEATAAGDGEDDPWRTIFIDKVSIIAIESGPGVVEEEDAGD